VSRRVINERDLAGRQSSRVLRAVPATDDGDDFCCPGVDLSRGELPTSGDSQVPNRGRLEARGASAMSFIR
jgi:hypothetical protein